MSATIGPGSHPIEDQLFIGGISSLAQVLGASIIALKVEVSGLDPETEQADISNQSVAANWDVNLYEATVVALLDIAVEDSEEQLRRCNCSTCDDRLWRLREALAVFKKEAVKDLAR